MWKYNYGRTNGHSLETISCTVLHCRPLACGLYSIHESTPSRFNIWTFVDLYVNVILSSFSFRVVKCSLMLRVAVIPPGGECYSRSQVLIFRSVRGVAATCGKTRQFLLSHSLRTIENVPKSRKFARTWPCLPARARVRSDGKRRDAIPQARYRPTPKLTRGLAHTFMLPRIRVKQVTTGIPSLLPQRSRATLSFLHLFLRCVSSRCRNATWNGRG